MPRKPAQSNPATPAEFDGLVGRIAAVSDALRDDNAYERIDLVFYHRILKCHVLIELKAKKFNYADDARLGVYMAYYRKHVMAPDDNPPVGILLCTEIGHEMAEYVNTFVDPGLFVSKYEVQLPPREKIADFLKRENARFAAPRPIRARNPRGGRRSK